MPKTRKKYRKKRKSLTTKWPPGITASYHLRLIKTVGKRTFVILAGKKSTNWQKSLMSMTFVRKKQLRHYKPNAIAYKLSAMNSLYRHGLRETLLFDIYYQPSRVPVHIRKLAGQYYKRTYKTKRLPPMVKK